MNKTKALLSIFLCAVLSIIVVSCDSDDPVPTGVTLSGSWVTSFPKILPTQTFEYKASDGSTKNGEVQAVKVYLNFIPVNKFATSGKGMYLVEYLHGPIAKEYRSFKWDLIKDDPNNTVTKVTFDDNNEMLTLYRTSIGTKQFSYSKNVDFTDPVPYDVCTTINWNAFSGSGQERRDDNGDAEWIEDYEYWRRSIDDKDLYQ